MLDELGRQPVGHGVGRRVINRPQGMFDFRLDPVRHFRDVETALGVDLGVINIATTSEGVIMTSEVIERHRQRMQRLRSMLQARGSLSAKRHLRQLAGRQRRFQKTINHQISKRLVEEAQRTNRAIALEDLMGTRADEG